MTGPRRLTGVYAAFPMEMLQHACALTLQAAAALVHMRQGAAALRTICHDARLTDRAARMLCTALLRQVLSARPVLRTELLELANELFNLTRES